MLAIGYSIVSPVASNFIFPNVMIVSRTLEILVAIHSSSQIRVRKYDQEKLTFFTPSGKEKAYTIIPFRPKNAPVFYTDMIHILCDE